jgi:hypothetical protein
VRLGEKGDNISSNDVLPDAIQGNIQLWRKRRFQIHKIVVLNEFECWSNWFTVVTPGFQVFVAMNQ